MIDCAYCGDAVHSSFQIRLPYVKGMLHQVDFRDFLMSVGTTTITDSWGVNIDTRFISPESARRSLRRPRS